LLKTQIDELSAENSSLKLKTESLADEVSKLKVESSAAQQLANKQCTDAELKEKGLQQRLLAALDSLRGEYHPLPDTSFSLGASFC
jgi:regulator of replication initiation timing